MQIIKNSSISKRRILSVTHLSLASVFAFLILIFPVNIYSQNPRPTPTPKKEVPEVISRDSDSTSNPSENDVNERTDSTENIKLPPSSTASNTKTESDEISKKQKKMVLYLDLLTKTEQRAASLQKQLFELLEKQGDLSTKLKQLEYQLRPEVISATTGLTGSLRPEDLREQKKQSLELEKSNVETLLQRLDSRRSTLEESVRKAEALVEKIRVRFDRILDAALAEDEEFL